MASSSSTELAVTFCGDDDCEHQVEAGRSDARYCSSACRQRSYRRRKRVLAPYGGDLEWAAADALAKMLAVTASTGTSRNAKEADDDGRPAQG